MSNSIHIEIVSTEKEIFSGEATMLFAPAEMGEVGIAPGHTPMVTRLGPGEVRVQSTSGEEQNYYISGGILEVQPKVVTILSDTAQRAADLDEAAIKKARKEAERAFHDKEAKVDYAKAHAALAETAAQLQAIRRLKKRTRS